MSKKLMLEQEQTAMSEDNTIENMIDYAANADFNKANAVFNDMIAQKMDAAMDQERIAVAGKVFNDVEPEELEAEAEADEIEATAETEEASESEETDEAEVEGHPV
jgi:hypothetical protein